MSDRSSSFDEYWGHFLRLHADPRVRRLRFAATTLGLGVAVSGVLTRRPTLLVAATALAFAPGVVARALWGADTTAVDGQPLFLVLSALKAWHLTLVGAMDEEVARAAAPDEGGAAEPSADAMPRPNMVTDHTLH